MADETSLPVLTRDKPGATHKGYRFKIDNNLIENSIRPVALGRKNYLFAGSRYAAQQAAIIYSLLSTCKINNAEPFGWLKHTLNVIPDYPANQLHKLLLGRY